MNQINNILNSLENSDRIKVFLPNGAFIQGKKKKIQHQMQYQPSDLEVYKTETGFTAVPLHPNLKKEVVIYLK